MLDWLLNNKEWLFSGVGIFALGLIMSIFSKNKNKNNPNQVIKNITSSGSITINQANNNSKITIASPERKPAKLELVDIYEKEEDSDVYIPIIEVKLRNSGDEVAFVKQAKFRTLNHWDIHTDHHPSLKEVSATYDLNISENIGSISCLKIPHEIKPQETDRIEFRLSTKYFGDPNGLSIFLLEVSLSYNEDSSTVTSKLLIHIPYPAIVQGSYFPGYSKTTISRNKNTAREILSIERKKITIPKHIKEALESWLNAPDED